MFVTRVARRVPLVKQELQFYESDYPFGIFKFFLLELVFKRYLGYIYNENK